MGRGGRVAVGSGAGRGGPGGLGRPSQELSSPHVLPHASANANANANGGNFSSTEAQGADVAKRDGQDDKGGNSNRDNNSTAGARKTTPKAEVVRCGWCGSDHPLTRKKGRGRARQGRWVERWWTTGANIPGDTEKVPLSVKQIHAKRVCQLCSRYFKSHGRFDASQATQTPELLVKRILGLYRQAEVSMFKLQQLSAPRQQPRQQQNGSTGVPPLAPETERLLNSSLAWLDRLRNQEVSLAVVERTSIVKRLRPWKEHPFPEVASKVHGLLQDWKRRLMSQQGGSRAPGAVGRPPTTARASGPGPDSGGAGSGNATAAATRRLATGAEEGEAGAKDDDEEDIPGHMGMQIREVEGTQVRVLQPDVNENDDDDDDAPRKRKRDEGDDVEGFDGTPNFMPQKLKKEPRRRRGEKRPPVLQLPSSGALYEQENLMRPWEVSDGESMTSDKDRPLEENVKLEYYRELRSFLNRSCDTKSYETSEDENRPFEPTGDSLRDMLIDGLSKSIAEGYDYTKAVSSGKPGEPLPLLSTPKFDEKRALRLAYQIERRIFKRSGLEVNDVYASKVDIILHGLLSPSHYGEVLEKLRNGNVTVHDLTKKYTKVFQTAAWKARFRESVARQIVLDTAYMDVNTEEEESEDYAITAYRCGRCGKKQAKFIAQVQTRSADEGMTTFLQCKCGQRIKIGA